MSIILFLINFFSLEVGQYSGNIFHKLKWNGRNWIIPRSIFDLRFQPIHISGSSNWPLNWTFIVIKWFWTIFMNIWCDPVLSNIRCLETKLYFIDNECSNSMKKKELIRLKHFTCSYLWRNLKSLEVLTANIQYFQQYTLKSIYWTQSKYIPQNRGVFLPNITEMCH